MTYEELEIFYKSVALEVFNGVKSVLESETLTVAQVGNIVEIADGIKQSDALEFRKLLLECCKRSGLENGQVYRGEYDVDGEYFKISEYQEGDHYGYDFEKAELGEWVSSNY